MKKMYKASVNSPDTFTRGNLTLTATEFEVADSGIFGELGLPFPATLGTGSTAETILVTAINGNVLTVQRAYEGIGRTWQTGTPLARNFTAYDHNAFKENIEELDTNKQNKTDNTLKTTSKEVVGAINELSSNKQNKTDTALKTTDKTIVGGINEIYKNTNALESDFNTHANNKSIHGSNINYNATATYSNGVYNLTLNNPPITLPTNYTVNFNAPTNVKKGDKVRVGDSVVNLYGDKIKTSFFPESNDNITVDNCGVMTFTSSTTDKYVTLRTKEKASDYLKVNTQYTLVLEVFTNFTSGANLYYSSNLKQTAFTTTGYVNSKGLHKILLTTLSDLSNSDLFTFQFNAGVEGAIEKCNARTMLLEGDWTNKELPVDYWEDSYKLINLMGKGFNSPASEFILNSAKLLGNSYVSVTERVDAEYGSAKGLKAKGILKPSTTYTLIIDVKEWNASKHITINLPTWVDAPYNEAISIPTKTLGITKIKVTTKSEITDAMYIMRVGMANNGNGKNVVLRQMLLEGDWTNRDLPCEYWENTFGEYPILTYGENSPPIEDNAFVQGQPITLNVGLTGAFFKSGGGGGGSLPSTWVEKANGIAQEPIKKDDAIIRMKYGNMDNAISLADVSGIDVGTQGKSSTAWSHDGKWLATCNRVNTTELYQIVNDTYTLKKTIPSVYCFSFAQASNYFVTLKTDNKFEYYSFNDNDFTLISTTPNATRNISYPDYLDIQLNPDGTEVFTSSKSGIGAFKRHVNGINFVEMLMPRYYCIKPRQISLSKDGMYLMAFSDTYDGTENEKNLYKKVNGTWNLIKTFTDLTASPIIRTAIHSTGEYLFANTSSALIDWYKNDGQDNFTKMPTQSIRPLSAIQSLEVSPCGNYLVVGGLNYLYIYKIENDILVKMPNPSEITNGVTEKNSIKFKNDGSKLAVGTSSTPYLYVYQTETKTSIKKLNSLDLANRLATNKLLELGVGKADTNAEVNQTCNVTLIKGINDHLGGIYA